MAQQIFQSALPRGERRLLLPEPLRCTAISIRAPARGATLVILGLPTKPHISIRAPARGATSSFSLLCMSPIFQSALPRGERPSCARSRAAPNGYFNPRSREGSDYNGYVTQDAYMAISIRAPARGATFIVIKFPKQSLHFNPRSREGSDET